MYIFCSRKNKDNSKTVLDTGSFAVVELASIHSDMIESRQSGSKPTPRDSALNYDWCGKLRQLEQHTLFETTLVGSSQLFTLCRRLANGRVSPAFVIVKTKAGFNAGLSAIGKPRGRLAAGRKSGDDRRQFRPQLAAALPRAS